MLVRLAQAARAAKAAANESVEGGGWESGKDWVGRETMSSTWGSWRDSEMRS